MTRFLISLVILLLTACPASAQEIRRSLLIGTWCDASEHQTEVYDRDGTAHWTNSVAELHGDWYWLPLATNVFVVQFGQRRAFFEILTLTQRSVTIRSLRTRVIYFLTRGRCS